MSASVWETNGNNTKKPRQHTIGIFGLGTTGNALYRYLDNPNILRNDPRLGFLSDMSECSVVFVCVPAPASQITGEQDLSIIQSCLDKLNKKCVVFLRSTVVPGTADKLRVNSLPEFLTERRAFDDMCRLPLVCGALDAASRDTLKSIFPSKEILFMKPAEAETVKYFHNIMGASNVTIANIFYDLCKKMNLDYEVVKQGFLSSGLFTPNHISVPGHDGSLGYGGKCFPENVLSLLSLLDGTPSHDVLFSIHRANFSFRYGNSQKKPAHNTQRPIDASV